MFTRTGLIEIASALVLITGLFLGGVHIGKQAIRSQWNQAKAEAAEREKKAIFERIKANERQVEQDKINNQKIAKAYEKELSNVRSQLANARLRFPSAVSGAAANTQAPDASGNSATNPGGGLVPESVAKRIRELIEETERVAAIARACQKFVSGS